MEHYPHIIPDIGEKDQFWEFFNFWAEKYGCQFCGVKDGTENGKKFTRYELHSKRGRVYISSAFYWGESTLLTNDVCIFGQWTSKYADASLIDDVISKVSKFRVGTVPKLLNNFVNLLHIMLYQYGFYNHDETAYKHAANVLIRKLPVELQVSACIKCSGEKSYGTSYAKELREEIRKGNEAEWVRPYSKLINSFFCPGLSDSILSVLDKNNIEIVEVSSHIVKPDAITSIRERGKDFICEPDELNAFHYKLSVPNKGTKEFYCFPFYDKQFASEFRKRFGFVGKLN